MFKLDGVTPKTAAMFEDDPRNLVVPKALGMRTVFVAEQPLEQDHIEHHTSDLANFLQSIT